MHQIFVRNNNRKQMAVATNNIVRIEASSNYSKIYFTDARPLTVAKVLLWFETNLPQDSFYRIHQTHIVNRFFVKEVQENNVLKMTTGEQIQASRRKQPVYKMMLAKIASE